MTRTFRVRLPIGPDAPQGVEVVYRRRLRLLRVRVGQRTLYRHWGLLPWASQRARDFKTPGPETHTLMVEPPGSRSNLGRYVVWLDGQVVLRISR